MQNRCEQQDMRSLLWKSTSRLSVCAAKSTTTWRTRDLPRPQLSQHPVHQFWHLRTVSLARFSDFTLSVDSESKPMYRRHICSADSEKTLTRCLATCWTTPVSGRAHRFGSPHQKKDHRSSSSLMTTAQESLSQCEKLLCAVV